jgi:hypothetical protein
MTDEESTPRPTNHLAGETSPYLLQHAHNPVDWYPWGDDPFEKARREDRPVFVSVGYSTCHWCHVMERESFEDQGVARILNENFVSIKVDREERPELDSMFMSVTQMATGRGGWPNSVWLTPEGYPWYAGTYWPREDTGGRAGFKTVLRSLRDMWQNRRHEVEEKARQWKQALQDSAETAAEGRVDRSIVREAVRALHSAFDPEHGGFGGAPKFPPHGSLRLLLHLADKGQEGGLEMATRTLDAMALGGVRDHLAGGFHRYSTDAHWLLPHFEKMLYDNAQLACAYAQAHELTGRDLYARVARETCDWVLREMTDEHGGFYTAVDADSEGEEGRYYLWTREQVLDALGPEEGELFCRVYDVRPEGNFRDEATGQRTGANVLHLERPLRDTARREGTNPNDLRERIDAARRKLHQVRCRREPPLTDDKVLAAWNGLMIGAMASCGRRLGEERYVQAAERAADFVLREMRQDGRLSRSYRRGRARGRAYLEDYAHLACGLLDLHAARPSDELRVQEAEDLVTQLNRHYRHPEGGYYQTADDHEDLLLRQRSPLDQASPSGNAMAALALLQLGQITGKNSYLCAGERTVEAFAGIMRRAPRATETLIVATDRLLGCARVRAPAEEPIVSLHARPKPAFSKPGGTARYDVVLHVAPDWHVYSDQPLEKGHQPTELWIEDAPGLDLVEVHYPTGEAWETDVHPEPVGIYQGEVQLRTMLSVGQGVRPGRHEFRFCARVQPCDEARCLAPRVVQTTAELEIRS